MPALQQGGDHEEVATQRLCDALRHHSRRHNPGKHCLGGGSHGDGEGQRLCSGRYRRAEPGGDAASDPKLAWLIDEECAAAKAKGFKIGVVMQTMNIQWSTEQVRGITDGAARCGAKIIGVTNPDFAVEKQIGQIDDMIQLKPDAVISIPVDDVATAASYKKVQQAGIKLVMMDNVPKG